MRTLINDTEIEALYPKIGQAAMDAVPGGFKCIWAVAEVLDGVSGTEVFYQTEEDEFRHIYDNVKALDEFLVELHGAFIMAGHAPWSSVTLVVDACGKFSLEYGYEDVSDFERAGERREKWLAKYLGVDTGIIVHE